MTIEYKPGRLNQAADALSRRPHPDLPQLGLLRTVTVAGTADSLIDRLSDHWAHEGHLPGILIDGLLYEEGERNDEAPRLLIPASEDFKDLRTIITRECHSSEYSGHLGLDKTLDLVQRGFKWDGMTAEVKEFVQTCLTCQQIKHSTQKKAGLLQPLPIPDKKWDQISMDLITQLPVSRSGNDCIVVFVDRLTKMIHLAACKTAIKSHEIADLLIKTVVKYHGVPSAIVSDRDTRFTSNFWKAVMKALGTELLMSTAYHPQTDGLTERANQTLEQILRTTVNEDQDNWDECLHLAEFAYNNSKQASTGHSPFFLNYGVNPNTPIQVALQTNAAKRVPAAMELLKGTNEKLEQARVNTAAAQDRQKTLADQHRRGQKFEPGDKVMLSTENFHIKPGKTRKLAIRYDGPFEVLENIKDTSYRLKLRPNMKRVHPVFHAKLLKPFKSGTMHDEPSTTSTQPRPEVPGPIHVFDDGPKYYIAEKILGEKKVRGVTKYLVKWKGYEDADNSWEPISNLKNVKDNLLEEYKASKKKIGR